MRWTAGGSAPSARGREVLATHRYILRLKLLQNSLDLKNPIFATRCVGVGGRAAFEPEPQHHHGSHITVHTCYDQEAPLKENESNDITFQTALTVRKSTGQSNLRARLTGLPR